MFICQIDETAMGPEDEESTMMIQTPLGIHRRGERAIAEPNPEEAQAAIALVRSELRKMLDAEPFGVATLNKIRKFAEASRALLGAYAPETMLPAGLMAGGEYGNGEIQPMAEPYTLVQSAAAETFGAKALREMVSGFQAALAPKKESPKASIADLVDALGLARSGGMDDVALEITEALRKRIGDGEPAVVPEMVKQAVDEHLQLHAGESAAGNGAGESAEAPTTA